MAIEPLAMLSLVCIAHRGELWLRSRPDQSSNPKVFAAGDIRRGQSLVVWAIPEGRQAVDLELHFRHE